MSRRQWREKKVKLSSGREVYIDVMVLPPERDLGIGWEIEDWRRSPLDNRPPFTLTAADKIEIEYALHHTDWTQDD